MTTSSNQHGAEEFGTTRWSRVAQAAADSSPESRRALAQLCEDYWFPLYAFARSRTASREDAQDLTQAFFAELLARNRFSFADPERGRFRTFLLSSLENFMNNQWRRLGREIRGGRVEHFSINFADGDRRYDFEPQHDLSPTAIFERQWAMTILDQSMGKVRRSYQESHKAALFDALKAHLGGGDDKVPYREIAEQLEMSESAVKVAAHRLRQKCRQAVRDEIAETVATADEIDDELRHLMTALQRA